MKTTIIRQFITITIMMTMITLALRSCGPSHHSKTQPQHQNHHP